MTHEEIPRDPPSRRAPGDDGVSGRPQPEVRVEGSGVAGGLIALLAIGALLVIIVAQNTDRVTFDLLWWSFRPSLAVLLLATALLTLLVDQIVGAIWRRRRRRVKALTAKR